MNPIALNIGTSDVVAKRYREWQDRAFGLLKPLQPLMEVGRASIPIVGKASDHDANADRLESVARPLLLFAHWRYSLNSIREEGDLEVSRQMETWFREALLLGTNPASEEFWGWSSNFHQHSVEMGLLVIALEMSRDWLWQGYEDAERAQILTWLSSDVGNAHHWNNHMFFGIFVMEFLLREGFGSPSYRSVIDRWFSDLEDMYLGGGLVHGRHESVRRFLQCLCLALLQPLVDQTLWRSESRTLRLVERTNAPLSGKLPALFCGEWGTTCLWKIDYLPI